MNKLPAFVPVALGAERAGTTKSRLSKLDGLLVILPKKPSPEHFGGLPAHDLLERMARDASRRDRLTSCTRLANERATVLTLTRADIAEPYALLGWARSVITRVLEDHPGKLGVTIRGFADDERMQLIDALASAAEAAAFELPKYKSRRKRTRKLRSLVFLEQTEQPDLRMARAGALGNNVARWLTAQPPNKLDAVSYRNIVEQIANEHELGFRFIGEAELRNLGAGAFLAVAQGNADREAGIAHLQYLPAEEPQRRIGLVGKGILFDTGGVNLKPFKSMLDMHTDMQGSAVAIGTLVALASMRAPVQVDAWLAISANCISATAYKSQDVVTASNGTTIQVIHTDAEGRMVLADTLAIAAREAPDLLIDFATLTGTCVSALTTRYSGVFTNRRQAHEALIAAGRNSGERVWPFPMDADYEDLIASEVADVRQCAVDGSGDHIVAARFLSRFVPNRIPWVHVDLSAGQHRGGLAHIPTQITGFGVRFALHLLDPLAVTGSATSAADVLLS